MLNARINFYKYLFVAIIAGAFAPHPINAAVVNRPTASNTAAAARAQNRTGARVPTISTTQPTTVSEPAPEPVVEQTPVETIPEPTPEPVIIVDNKTSLFEDVLADIGASATDTSDSDRAETIRRQRALLDATSNTDTTTPSGITTANTCDAGLRKCMSEKCGTDFSKCANDSTTVWGEKMDSCRRITKCTGHEYSLLAPEILADRDANVQLAHYNSVINCGNRYNDCIFTECGTTLNKCLAKRDGDNAVSKCASIARDCRSADSGLAGRVSTVFGDLRKIATSTVQRDEKRLYELRDLMRSSCNRMGAVFDERTLDCVYTVNFLAGDDSTIMASKKLYAGDSFQCNANWFGIDITTFKENAYRRTRAQTSASAAALGAGVGMAAGMLSSGAIDRAIASHKAEKALNEVKAQQQEQQQDNASSSGVGENPNLSLTRPGETGYDARVTNSTESGGGGINFNAAIGKGNTLLNKTIGETPNFDSGIGQNTANPQLNFKPTFTNNANNGGGE